MSEPIGSNDSSIEILTDDLLDVSQYVNGLASFIKSCVTPMTVSIQGDWGSGKTSMMNMVQEKLGNSVVPVWFNTWQYSQFNMGDDLAVSLLGRLIKELGVKGSSDGVNIKDALKIVYKAVKSAGVMAADHFVGSAAAEQMEKLADKFANGEDDAAEAINSLKEKFQACVNHKLENSPGKDRIVVFIDDLDRLNPGKAVELLEVLKVFLDCKKCVFILAIDYSVVSQGVKEKYGDLIGEDKGKSFFDKIIQVPFKMPVAHYKVDRFIAEMFRQVGIELNEDPKDAELYKSLIQTSVGCNPRTMKRLFNAYLLLEKISEFVEVASCLRDPEKGDWYRRMLFAILCCQHAYDELYTFMIQYHDDFAGSDLLELMQSPANYSAAQSRSVNEEDDGELADERSGNEKLVAEFRTCSDERIQRMALFMRFFVKTIDADGNNSLDIEELRGFAKLLTFTTITSAGNREAESEDSVAGHHRVVNRTIMNIVLRNVTEDFQAMNGEVHPVYQSQRDGDDGWKAHYADIWTDFNLAGRGVLDFECALKSDLSDGSLHLYCYTKRRRSFKKSDYTDYCTNHPLISECGFAWLDGIGLCKEEPLEGKVTDSEKEQQEIAAYITKQILSYASRLK